MLLNAKQGQNKKIISELVTTLKPRIEKAIKNNNIDAVVFIPPTIKRTVQFMDELEQDLNLNIPKIQIDKVSGEVIVPQKSLIELEDRIENAQNTFFLTSSNKYGNILILDDAIGSGSSLNEVASKIRSKNINTGKIVGLSIVGSFSGFDVISEV
jgi:predicted amidophosphoribosyltransferase